MRTADNETSGRIDKEFCILINHLCRQNLVKYIFFNILMDLLLGYFLVMLGGKNHCIQTGWFAVFIVLYGYLCLAVRAQVAQGSVFADLGQLACQFVCQINRIWHIFIRFVGRITKHHTLIAGTDCLQLLVGHLVLFCLQRFINSHRDIRGLLIQCHDHAAGITVKTVFRTVITDLTNGIADYLLDIHIAFRCDLAHNHNQTGCRRRLTSHTAHRILL